MTERPETATSPLLRRMNATVVLEALRGAEPRAAEPMTVTELMEETGLSRPTVHTVCDELIRLGWVRAEDMPQGQVPRRGRRARRYTFNERGGYVVGMDLGANKVTVVVSDLSGTAVEQETRQLDDSADRLDTARDVVTDSLRRAEIAEEAVLAVGLAVPGSVRHDGTVKVADWWLPGRKAVDLRTALEERFAWPVLVENDANLAVLGERSRGVAGDVDDVVLLLAGERLGAGVFINGRLVRGAGGAAGEMGFLSLVEHVGTAEGIGALTRKLSGLESAQAVFAAARSGDSAAGQVVQQVCARIARAVAVLATLLDPELVVVGGAVAEAGDVLLGPLEREVAALCDRPPRLLASALGDRAVVEGAVRFALQHVLKRIFAAAG
ncbi:ROK family protein [Allokutzneria sp. A3M-2-11 16]|uniref:ROK family transcriptional regulator n=1 Tax=Allokutzneria sp. A3M-2-11 16 TaxID=2962043 RepID=UPI0020B7A70B|nr:ROK family transcriptional regulator [Allokutzneria sp. A3M-2-11 16]MCP3802615.1 ROK family protein [Allokutzneria sp. A3M-2-11 16]